MYIFNQIDPKDKNTAVERLIEGSTPSHNFYIMVILAIAMATLGLLLDNTAIVIGSMLVSPLLFSLLGVSMGLSMSNGNLIKRSIYTFLRSLLLGVAVALIVTWLFPSIDKELNPQIISRTFSGLPYAGVAFIAGFAAAFSLVSSKLNESLAGIAISVALIPPIATVGIGIGLFRFDIIQGSIILLVTNVVGILAASLIVFSAMNFHNKKKLADQTIKAEDKEVKKTIGTSN